MDGPLKVHTFLQRLGLVVKVEASKYLIYLSITAENCPEKTFMHIANMNGSHIWLMGYSNPYGLQQQHELGLKN